MTTSNKTIISLSTLERMVDSWDSNLVNCRIDDDLMAEMYDNGGDELYGPDIEAEGYNCLVTDRSGNVIRFDGYISKMDSTGDWEG